MRGHEDLPAAPAADPGQLVPDRTSVLGRLVQPVDCDEFCREHWNGEPLTIHGPLERLALPFTGQMSDSIDGFLGRYRGRVVFGRGSRGPRAVISQETDALALFGMGLTLYLPDLEPQVEGASEWLRSLESDLGLPAGVARLTAWASPADDGAACHFDTEEVFSVQLVGRKTFSISQQPAMTFPVGSQYGPDILAHPDLPLQVDGELPHPSGAVFDDVDMSPGSVLFLPRGYWHRTAARVDSLSITVAIGTPTRLDGLLAALRQSLLRNPAWRRPLGGVPIDDSDWLRSALRALAAGTD